MGNTCCGAPPEKEEQFSDIRRGEQQPLASAGPPPPGFGGAHSAAQQSIQRLQNATDPVEAAKHAEEALAHVQALANQSQPPPESQPPPAAKKKIVRTTKAEVHHSTASKKSTAEKLDYSSSDSSKWVFSEKHFAGACSYSELGKKELVEGLITEGVENFKANPGRYLAMMYQTSMVDWPEDQQKYTYIYRQGTRNWKPTGCSDEGWMSVRLAEFQCLPPLEDLGAGKFASCLCGTGAECSCLSQMGCPRMQAALMSSPTTWNLRATGYTTRRITRSAPGGVSA